jgi:RNA polymerase sigma-70 factor (ECF subfamily)
MVPQPRIETNDFADFTAHREAVRGFLVSVLGNPALAEDLTQETWLRAERSRESYRGEASVKSWLFSIALNLARDHYRATARRGNPVDLGSAETLPSDVPGAELAAMQKEMSACIGDYVLQLRGRQSDVLALRDMGGLDHAEIAALLGVSEANARVLLHRGRAALRTLLKEHCILSFDEAIPCEPHPRKH